MNKIIFWTGNNFIDSLMKEVNQTSLSHRPLPHIQQQAYEYLIQQNIWCDLARDAAEAVAKARRSDLDIGYLEALAKTLANN